jgi:16S rRNA (cytosine967-C5)-methyltransferase
LRAWRRLTWWLTRAGAQPAPRLVVAASLLTEGTPPGTLTQLFSGGRFAPTPLTSGELQSLRRVAAHTLDHPDMPEAVQIEVPDWLLPLLRTRFGASLPAEMAALAEPAPLDLRVNLLKTTRDAARAALAAEGIEATPTRLSPWGLRVAGRRPVTTGTAFRAGLVEIQDEGSQLIAFLADARPGARVSDLCAGAGGKSLAMAMTMGNTGHILACDVSATRLESAVRRLRRAGVHNVERHLLAPGAKALKRRAGSFDRALVDAPCTGIGTWRRNPDARRRLDPADLAELLPKQAAILDQAAGLVRIGGKLIYATCSLLFEENEAQVSGFLARHSDFAIVPLPRAWPDGVAPSSGEFLVLTPARHGTDGFFAAVLERRRESPS